MLFERFNEKAKRALFFARSAAHHLASGRIDPHHFLLGILEIEDGVVAEIFRRYGIKANDIRAELGAKPIREHPMAEMPLSEDAKKVLADVAHEAATRGHSVTPAHLLLGILRVEGTEGRRILVDRGADDSSLHRMILELCGDPAAYAKPHGERPPSPAPDFLIAHDPETLSGSEYKSLSRGEIIKTMIAVLGIAAAIIACVLAVK